MKTEEFENLPNHFAERVNGGSLGSGVLQYGFKAGFNKAVELLGARVEHSKDCYKMKHEIWDEAQQAINFSPDGPDKIYAQQEIDAKRHTCTCGLDLIMKGYPQHG